MLIICTVDVYVWYERVLIGFLRPFRKKEWCDSTYGHKVRVSLEITDFAGMRSRQNAILLISQPSSSTNGCKFGEVVRVDQLNYPKR